MPVRKLKAYLDEAQIKYLTIGHSNAYTSQEIAASSHISGKEFAKTVIVKVDGDLAMVVLPASFQIDFDRIKTIFGTENVTLATEAEFKDCFPDCEVGAIPPFGNLYGMPVFVADSLAQHQEIAFSAGTHTEVIRLNYADFRRLVKPRIFRFSWKTKYFPTDPMERWLEDYRGN